MSASNLRKSLCYASAEAHFQLLCKLMKHGLLQLSSFNGLTVQRLWCVNPSCLPPASGIRHVAMIHHSCRGMQAAATADRLAGGSAVVQLWKL